MPVRCLRSQWHALNKLSRGNSDVPHLRVVHDSVHCSDYKYKCKHKRKPVVNKCTLVVRVGTQTITEGCMYTTQASSVRRRGHLANRPATSDGVLPFSPATSDETIQVSALTTGGPNSDNGGGKQALHSGLLQMQPPVGAQSNSAGATAFSKI